MDKNKKEIIVNIEESFNDYKDKWYDLEGFEIKTSEQKIFIGISNNSSCCEKWGYFITNDSMQEFIGAELLSVDIVDNCLNKDKAPEVYEGGVMYVNLETSKGTLQFTAYNSHNGYYGHKAVVISKQISGELTL